VGGSGRLKERKNDVGKRELQTRIFSDVFRRDPLNDVLDDERCEHLKAVCNN
jgi:hypothetical protein